VDGYRHVIALGARWTGTARAKTVRVDQLTDVRSPDGPGRPTLGVATEGPIADSNPHPLKSFPPAIPTKPPFHDILVSAQTSFSAVGEAQQAAPSTQPSTHATHATRTRALVAGAARLPGSRALSQELSSVRRVPSRRSSRSVIAGRRATTSRLSLGVQHRQRNLCVLCVHRAFSSRAGALARFEAGLWVAASRAGRCVELMGRDITGRGASGSKELSSMSSTSIAHVAFASCSALTTGPT